MFPLSPINMQNTYLILSITIEPLLAITGECSKLKFPPTAINVTSISSKTSSEIFSITYFLSFYVISFPALEFSINFKFLTGKFLSSVPDAPTIATFEYLSLVNYAYFCILVLYLHLVWQ